MMDERMVEYGGWGSSGWWVGKKMKWKSRRWMEWWMEWCRWLRNGIEWWMVDIDRNVGGLVK